MLTTRRLFNQVLGQTSLYPMGLEIIQAKGSYLYDNNGKEYLDFISGIAVSNLGHCFPPIVEAIKSQAEMYSHLMVYGEYIQSPQVVYAELLTETLPRQLDNVFFTNSGGEAIDGAIKLAKKYTKRTEIISFKNAYHGSTSGPLSLMGDENLKQPFRPLIPGVVTLQFNDVDSLSYISENTAAVFVEPIQGEAGVIMATVEFLNALKKKCYDTGTLLVFDEIQTGMGRTGQMYALNYYNIVPDILCLAKSLGGGLPLGAFISSKEIMRTLSIDPPLGHISTFGGNAICCAAGLAMLKYIYNPEFLSIVRTKGEYLLNHINSDHIKAKRGVGLFAAVEFESYEFNIKVINSCLKNGLITDWFLFNNKSMRMAPPLNISHEELDHALEIINISI